MHHNTVAVAVRKAKVRIVIITRFFLDHLKTFDNKFCHGMLNRILHSTDVIAVLNGIKAQEIVQNYQESKEL